MNNYNIVYNKIMEPRRFETRPLDNKTRYTYYNESKTLNTELGGSKEVLANYPRGNKLYWFNLSKRLNKELRNRNKNYLNTLKYSRENKVEIRKGLRKLKGTSYSDWSKELRRLRMRVRRFKPEEKERRRVLGLKQKDIKKDLERVVRRKKHKRLLPIIKPFVDNFSYEYKEYPKMGMRKYDINIGGIESAFTNNLFTIISNRITQTLRSKKGFTKNSSCNIQLVISNTNSKGNKYQTSKSFNEFLLKNSNTFYNQLRLWGEETINERRENYTFLITNIKIKIIKENSGGCSNTKKTKTIKIGNNWFVSPPSKNNDCYFKCIIDLCDFGVRFTENKGNDIRKEFNLEKASCIPPSIGIEIFKKYRKDKNENIEIVDSDSLIHYVSDKKETNIKMRIGLTNNHYTIIQGQKCPNCLSVYQKKHTCNSSRINYVNNKIKKNKKRSLICRNNEEKEVNNEYVLHYDLETYPKLVNGEKIHTPYIIGLCYENKYITFRGDNCMVEFIDFILKYIEGKKDLIYLNAYNGSNFDHYFVKTEFIRRKLKLNKFCMNNGSIIMFEYKNLKLFDLNKHLIGSLKNNLSSFGCKVQKGDFNHELGCRWEDMSEEVRNDCLKYLEGDCFGLKELYEKVNNGVFEEYGVNLTSYISTSSLTFNIWKNKIRKKFYIELPTLQQEKDFRQTIRGGRTYKSKSRFISEDYEKFKKGEITFKEVNDYVIDADVVSLYPTAMSKFSYPVGECKELKEGENEMKGKMGIYYIKYITNKNLQHSIGGRRDKDGFLKWDLIDSEGWFNSIDIEDMLSNGYKVEIIKGYYWEKTDYIFKEYIEGLFEKKKNSKKGSVKYSLSKLFMNSLYGKMIQRPIFTETEIINNNMEYWKMWGEYNITDINKCGNKWFVSGMRKDEKDMEKRITKPTHLGSFILGYSRRIMLDYIKQSNPYFNSNDIEKRVENDFYYTDTDSLQMSSKNAKLIKTLGNKDLGGITDDLGDNCKIIKGIWIAPKLYMLEYIKEGDNKSHFHFRGKGLNKEELNEKSFIDMDKGFSLTNYRNFQMKKIHYKRNKQQLHIDQFSIVHYNKEEDKDKLKRVVNMKKWEGRNFINDNESIPFLE